jgi:anaerobic magnesium-protoporphyrin IX monomethyl ester cyclase
MNIVIANGPGRLDNGLDVILFPSRWDSAVHSAPFRFYPYELGYLSTLLKRELPGAKVTMLDGNIRGWGAEQYAAEINKLAPDVLICECSALTYSTMTRVQQAVIPFTAKTILCGPMATYEGATLDGWTDTVVGEFEHKVLALLKGEAQPTGYIDLDWLPWPEDEDISRIDYDEINHYSRGTVQLYPTRGCPLSCTFCVVPTYYGGHGKSHRSHRCRDVENVCDEIEYLATKYDGRFAGCYFNEEAHNANVEWLTSFAETLIRRGLNKYQYDAMCGYWTFTEDIIKLLANAGYRQIRFGVESTSEQVGKSIKKLMHVEKLEQLMHWCKAAGIGCYGTFQIGAPGSTEQTDRQTIVDLNRWRQQSMMQKWQVSTSTPLPGTPFYQQAKANGWLITEDLSRFNGFHPVLSYPHYPAERIFQVRLAA